MGETLRDAAGIPQGEFRGREIQVPEMGKMEREFRGEGGRFTGVFRSGGQVIRGARHMRFSVGLRSKPPVR